jgi:hypothetical protein
VDEMGRNSPNTSFLDILVFRRRLIEQTQKKHTSLDKHCLLLLASTPPHAFVLDCPCEQEIK